MNKIFTLLFFAFAFSLQAQDFLPATTYFSSDNFDDDSNYEIIDFDADGDLDIIGGNDATVYLNDGMNSFDTEIFLADDEFRVTGDFNGDNQMDAVTEDSLVINNGDGTFTVTALFKKEFHLTGDFNNDGLDDLMTWDSPGLASLHMSFGNTDGTLTFPTQLASGPATMMAVKGDFNGDGNLDLAFTKNSSKIEVLTNNGDGTFTSEQFDTEFSDYHLNTSDLDNDGDLDLVWGARTTSKIGWALNDGTGSFGATQLENIVSSGPIVRPQGIAVADYDGDGFPDLFVSAGLGSSSINRYFENVGGADFTGPTSLPSLETEGFSEFDNITRLTAFDYDGDGNTDVAVHNETEIQLFINEGTSVIVEANNSVNFSIFPNPFAESIRVEAEELIGENVLLQLTDVTGKLVLSQKGQLPMNVKLTSELSQGNYILTVHSQETSALLVTGKLTK